MNWSFIAGLIVGGIIGMFLMSLMIAASEADNRMLGEDQYNEK
jgi:hypothetical protein